MLKCAIVGSDIKYEIKGFLRKLTPNHKPRQLLSKQIRQIRP